MSIKITGILFADKVFVARGMAMLGLSRLQG